MLIMLTQKYMSLHIKTIVRCVFIFFITCLAAYFLVANQDSKILEKFAQTAQTTQTTTEAKLPKNKDELAAIIIELYAEIYKTDVVLSNPSKKAVDFYVEYAVQRDITRTDLKQVISGSSVALEKTFNSKKAEVPSEVFGTEDEVSDIYNKILFRNPDETELYNFSKMLKDKSLDTEKLEQILYGSQEFQRLEKTQVNSVYSNLMGGVTERQISMVVEKVFAEATKGNQTLDSDTAKFLRKKLLSFNLDEKRFKAFVESYVVGKPFVDVGQSSSVSSAVTSSEQVNQKDLEKLKQDVLLEIRQNLTNGPKEQMANELSNRIAPNRQVIEVLLKTAKDSERENNRGTYLDSQDVLERIKDDAKCVFDKDAKDNYWAGAVDNRVAKLQDQRNTEELKNICERNRKFLGADEDMVLDSTQKWSVPQRRPPVCTGNKNAYQPVVTQTALIGTLLEEAKNTEVGSILPQLVPK